MNHSNYILTWLKEFSEKSNSTPYPDNDIRRDFSRFIFSAFDNYYKGCLLLDLSAQINFGNIRFDSTISPSHIEQIRKMSTDEKLYNSYFHSLNRTLLLDGWSSFENCISILRTKLLSEEDQVKLLCFRYREVVELLKGVQIPEKSKESLRVALVQSNLSHVPIPRKTDILFRKAKLYHRDKTKDKEFLLFLGRFRNTLHSNFIYYGKDYNFTFGDAEFKFENGQLLRWKDPFNGSPKLYFSLISELCNIWEGLINAIPFEGNISYPDTDYLH